MISLDAMPIELTSGNGHTWVDAKDHALLSTISWSLLSPHGKRSKTFYAVGRLPGDKNKTLMHRLIGSFHGISDRVDHKDGNGLNNTSQNLRRASPRQNQYNQSLKRSNTSGYIGVSKRNDIKRARCATIRIQGRSTYLGLFDSPESAARVRDAWAREAYGEYAVLNFPKEQSA